MNKPTANKTKIRAFAYVRVSGKGQIDGDGFPRQRAMIADYCRQNNMQVVEYFEERGVTGKSEWADRAAWVEMIGKLNGVKTIIVENLTRLARDLMVQEMILADLRKRDIVLVSASGEHTDEGDPTRVLIRQILGAFSQYEACCISAKLKAARNRIKASGVQCEGRKRYGHYEGERKVIETMLRLQSQGDCPSRIAKVLNEEEIPSRTGGQWHPFTVSRILNAQGVR